MGILIIVVILALFGLSLALFLLLNSYHWKGGGKETSELMPRQSWRLITGTGAGGCASARLAGGDADGGWHLD